MYVFRLQLIKVRGGDGFQAFARTERDGTPIRQANGFLPAIPPGLQQAFDNWRSSYISSGSAPRDPSSDPPTRFRDLRIQAISTEVSPCLIDDNSDRRLQIALNNWLDDTPVDGNWREIIDCLVGAKAAEEASSKPLRVLLQFSDDLSNDTSNNLRLSRLPWRSWSVFQNSNIEIAFAPPEGSHVNPYRRPRAARILIIVGNRQGIEQGIQKDIDNVRRLENLNAKVEVFDPPSYDDLRTKLRENSYEIVIFSGHSKSNEDGTTGWLALSNNKDVDISRLDEDLSVVVKKGL